MTSTERAPTAYVGGAGGGFRDDLPGPLREAGRVMSPELAMTSDGERVITLSIWQRSVFTERAWREIEADSRRVTLYRWLRSLGLTRLDARERVHSWRRKKKAQP